MLCRTFARILATLALTTLAFAVQDPTEIQKLNQGVLADITAKKFDDALVKLDKVLSLQPQDRGTAYNIACVQSLKADLDKAAEWAGKSVDWGWGSGWGSIAGQDGKELTEVEMFEQDADLENLRKDARWPAILERAKNLRKAVDQERGSAAVYIPEKIASLAEKPLLIVLHANGSTKSAVVSGRWKQVADDLGYALVAPSGRHLGPRANTPKDGMFWIRDPASYQARPWTDERPVQDAYTEFSKTNKIDKTRVLIAGDGPVGGIAINVAAASPYLYKGALSVGGVLMTPVVSGKAANVAKAGTRIEIVFEQKAALDMLGSAENVERVIKATNADLARWGIGGAARTYARDDKDPEQERKLIVERLKAIIDAPRAAEAAATTPATTPK